MKDRDGYRNIPKDWIQGWGQGLALSSSVEPSAPSSGGSKPPASNVPVGPLTVGGVAMDSAVGGKDMKVPLELDAVQKDGLLLVDVTPGVSGHDCGWYRALATDAGGRHRYGAGTEASCFLRKCRPDTQSYRIQSGGQTRLR